MTVRSELPQAAHEIDRGVEFLLGEAHFTREGMQMPDQRLYDLADARIGNLPRLAQHRLSDLLFALDDHVRSSPLHDVCQCVAGACATATRGL